jgi:signal transduction histidine kinase
MYDSRFYRPDPARSSGQRVGLGLAIVKSITELHGDESRSRAGLGPLAPSR